MPPKRKAGNAAYIQLKKDIAAGTPGPLYVFWGEEAYLRDHCLARMKKALLSPGMEAFNFHVLPGKDLTLQTLSQTVDTLPMMSERTLILVSDYDMFKAPAETRDALAALFADLPPYCCLVFVYDVVAYKPDARTKLAAAIKRHGAAVEFARQEQGDLIDWISRRFKALGHDIDSRDAQYLIFLCGDLMHTLISEIGKISAYAKGRRVTRQDIDTVAVPVLDAVVFQMTDAIARGDFDRAAAVMGDLLHMQEPPIKILSVMGRQLRQIYSARLALEAGKDTGYLVSLWGLRSAYPAEKWMGAARRFSLAWCREAVIRCAQADLAMKSVTGADAQALLVDLLLALANEKRSN
ncbi:MAG: DNA polymerase III subunit delta [Clostridiales bacterium]|nr:DNA polymerase III subunit delta [Clostridiales bacterium]